MGSNKLLECLKRIDKTSNSMELEKTAKCLIYAKIKENRLKKVGWKKMDDKDMKKSSKSVENRRSKRSYRLREKQFFVKTRDSYTLVDEVPKSPISRISNLLLTLLTNTTDTETEMKWESTQRRMKRLSWNMEQSRKSTLDTMNERVHDLVLDNIQTKKADHIENILDKIPAHPLMKQGIQLIKTMTGIDKDMMNTRILSPRFVPLSPNTSKRRGLLSPSIFPFYKDEGEEQILPIPDIIESTGIHKNEKEKVMSLIMEVSRTRPMIDETMKMVSLIGNPSANDKISKSVLTATDKMSKHFEKLEKSLNKKQRKEMDEHGFSLLETKQMKSIFDKYRVDDVLKKPEMINYYKYTNDERMMSLWKSIENIAFGMYQKKREKRQLPGPFVIRTHTGYPLLSFQTPTILTPYMFAPVYGISILGPVIFSPNIFSPLILNPSVLSPWIFSPAFPLPFILSPYLLSPYIFSPLVMAPFILTPYALSPNIFNPYVLSPLILSPLVLCPDIFSPMVLGGNILSPNALSPSIFSNSYIMASVLSPTILS